MKNKSVLWLWGFLGMVLVGMPNLNAIEKGVPKVSTKEAFRPNNVPKLAVLVSGPNKMEYSQRSPQSDQQRIVEDAFLGILIEKNYDVAVRSDLEKILDEQQLQNSGLTDTDSVKIGKLLNVPAVMLVHISELTLGAGPNRTPIRSGISNIHLATITLGARLIDVTTGSVLWTGTHRVELQVTGQRATDAIVKCSDELAEAFPKRDPNAEPIKKSNAATSPESTLESTPSKKGGLQGKRLSAAFVTGTQWEGTYARTDEEDRTLKVTWVVKERRGDDFVAEIQFPMRTQEIKGTVTGGTITWKPTLGEGRPGVEQSLRIRGDTIRGTLSRPSAEAKRGDTDVLLTRKNS